MTPIRKQLNDLVQKMGLLDEQQTNCCQLSLMQCHTLTAIGSQEGLSIMDLANQLTLDKSTTSRHVSNLVDAGLVIRKENSDDRRYFSLALTPSGQATHQSINATMDTYYEKLLSFLTSEEKEMIQVALDRLIKAVDQTGCC